MLITADGFLRRGVVGAAEGGGGRGGRGARRPSSACWSCGARATPSRRHGRPAATPGGTRRRTARPTRRLGCAATDPETPVHADLHLGHDRQAEGRRPRPRRLPDQGRAGPRPPVRPRARRHAVLVHRPRLDDGAVGDLRRRCCSARGSCSTRARPTSPARTGCGRWSSGTGSPTSGLSPTVIRALMAAWGGAGPLARPLLAARPRLDRRALEPGPVVVVLPRGRRGPLPDRQLLGRDRGLRRHRVGQPARADQAGVVLRPVLGTAADVVDEAGASVRGAVGELVIRAPDARHDPRVLAGPRALRGDVLVAHPRDWVHGDWASIDADGFWYIHGRSDDTLKVAGKRVGPAEVESAAVVHPAVAGGGRDRRARTRSRARCRRPVRAPPGRDRR